MRHLPQLAASIVLAACGGIAGGDRDATIASCKVLCSIETAAPGCSPSRAACDASCDIDGMAFSEDCLVKAKTYYDCAAQLAYACPDAPTQAVTRDTTCDADEHALLVCKLTGQ